MAPRTFWLGPWLIFLVGTSLPERATAQLIVAPRRASQSRVRHFEFEWRYADILVGATADTFEVERLGAALDDLQPVVFTGTESSTAAPIAEAVTSTGAAALDAPIEAGGIRLFFYERERAVAERAAPVIEAGYRRFVHVFGHVPRMTFPYVLYSTYREFLETNLFPLQEGVLGVTSPSDLKLTLPYFGDHRLFEEVSTHEMAHQFTIQKVKFLAKEADVRGQPLERMPLWFIEGLAEYYAQEGIDEETEMLARDLVVNPDAERGYAMLDFYSERRFSVLWTYKIGQIRCAFLEAEYGPGTIQRALDLTPRLVDSVAEKPRFADFPALLEEVTGDDPTVISARFEAWLKRRTFRSYLEKDGGLETLEALKVDDDLLNAFAAAPGGDLMLIRTFILETGQSRLALFDARAPKETLTVAIDGVIGAESLHPVGGRTFDLRPDALVYVAESNGVDVLYWRAVQHSAEQETVPVGKKGAWKVELDLGDKKALALADHGVIAAFSPSFSPEGDRVAFVGLDLAGRRDIYVVELADGSVERLTHDDYAERSVSWGPRGIVFNSDATSHRMFNLFLVSTDSPPVRTRLTSEVRDHVSPQALSDGRIFYVAYDRGSANIHEVKDGYTVQRTNAITGFSDLSPGRDGGLSALLYRSGRRRPVFVSEQNLLKVSISEPRTSSDPLPLAERSLNDSERYDPLAPRNWELGNIFGILGAGVGGVYGLAFVSAHDYLRDHSLILNVGISGKVELTDGFLLYVNDENRMTWGAGVFQELRLRTGRNDDLLAFAERFYGARGILHYPLSRFVSLQTGLDVGGVDAVDLSFIEGLSPPADDSDTLQTELSLRLGIDTIRYHPGTGPLTGNSLLLEAVGGLRPLDGQSYALFRLDAEHYLPIYGRTNLFMRLGSGASLGEGGRQFLLSSWYTLRGVDFDNLDYLLGYYFFYSTTELQVPLNDVIRLFLFTDLEAIVGFDFGGVGNHLDQVWDQRVLDFVTGVNFGLGPLVLRLHFAWPIGIGVPKPSSSSPVVNFSLGWFYF